MKESQQITVRVEGSGNSKQRAFATAIANVQREVLKNNSNIILRIEPLDVQVFSATAQITTEKFLFFFFPRKKEFYSVVLDVSVDICFVDISKVNFQ